jgi:hypothetical protein
MRRLIRSLVVVGGLAALVNVAPASAQVLEEVAFTTSFPFTVGQKTLPAGTYTVRPAYDGDGSLLQIQGRDDSAIFAGENAGTPRVKANEDAVVFDRTGDKYVLSEIWDGAEREGADRIPVKGAETVKVEAHRAHH